MPKELIISIDLSGEAFEEHLGHELERVLGKFSLEVAKSPDFCLLFIAWAQEYLTDSHGNTCGKIEVIETDTERK